MGNFDRKLAQRRLDRAEGTTTSTGHAAHSRSRHADRAAPHLADRLKNDNKLVASSFLNERDQDKAFSEAMQTKWGQEVILACRLDPKSRRRYSSECKITRNGNITILVARVVDRRQGLYAVYEAKLRSVMVVVEGDGRGSIKPITIFPADHYEIRQRQAVISCWL